MSWQYDGKTAVNQLTEEVKKLNKKMDDVIAAILSNGRVDPISDFGKIRDILKGREE
jgi:hypothetical protein